MKIQETRTIMVSLLVLTLSLILPAHAGQIIKPEKNLPSNISERRSGNGGDVSVSLAETDPALEKRAVLRVAAEVKESLENAGISGNTAIRRATGGSKMYVENNVKGTGQTAIRGDATATSAIGYDIVNYGGYFKAAGVKGRGVYGEATNAGNFQNYGGYFQAAGSTGRGVYGKATGTSGRGVYGHASNTGDVTNYGGHFQAEGNKGIGVYGTASNLASNVTNYGGYFQAGGEFGRGVYGVAINTWTNNINYGGYFQAGGGGGQGVYGTASGTNGKGVVGEALGSSGTGVWGWGGQYDFYAFSSGYFPFTGGHEVRLSEGFPENLLPGMIVSVTGQTQARKNKDGTVSVSSTLPTVKVSSMVEDRAVFGVFVSRSPLPGGHWYKAEEGECFGTVNALGEGRVWVTDFNRQVQAGDYITTSSVPGYGQLQDDDLLHSYTLGKAIETIDWDQVTETVQHDGKTYKRYLIAVVYTSG